MPYAAAPPPKLSLPLSLFAVIAVALLAAPALGGDWPRWRGPSGDGVTADTDLPQTWSPSQNVTWKAPLPGPGNSSPVVLGDRVFVTCASDKGALRSVLCFDRSDGKVRWRKDTPFKGEEPTH